MVWTLKVYSTDAATLLGTLSEAHSVRLVRNASRLSSSLTFTVDLESTADIALLQPRRVVKVTDGATDLGGYFVHDMPAVVLEPGELPGVSYTCLPLELWLGGGRVGGAVVYPFGGIEGKQDTDILGRWDPRKFGWQQLDFDDSGWGVPVGFGTKAAPVAPFVSWRPSDWPGIANGATRLYGIGTTLDAGTGTLNMPPGVTLYRQTWTITEPGDYALFATGENWEIWLDGQPLADYPSSDSGRSVTETVALEAGTYQFAATARNGGVATTSANNVSALMWSLHRVDPSAQLTLSAPVYQSNTSDVVVVYNPDPWPGVTIGFVLDTLITEAQARGALPGLTYTFDEDVDSDGTAWAVQLTHSWRLGSTLGWVAEQLTEFGCDFQVTSSGVLIVQAEAGTDLSGTVELDRLEQASLSGEGIEGNAALVVTPGGVDEKTAAGSVSTYGRVETGATFGTADEPTTVEQPVDELLSRMAWPRDDGDLSLSEESPQPFADFDVLDWVSFPDRSGGTQVGRVAQIDGVQNDADGTVDWTVTLDAVSASTNPVPSTVTENV